MAVRRTGGNIFQGGTYHTQINIDASKAIDNANKLDKVLTRLGTTLENMSRGRDVAALWNEQAASIQNVTKALDEFNRSQDSVNSAENLMKALNAFSAWHPDQSMTQIFSQLGADAENLITKAKSLATNLDSAFSVPSLSDAFSAFKALKNAGVDLEGVFAKLRQGDMSGLTQQVEILERSLSRANITIRDLQGELENVKSGEAFAAMEEKIARLENGIEMAKNEFRSFLELNGFSGWELNDNGRFSAYFEQIADGTMTATQAINQFKQEYSGMFSDFSSGDVQQVFSTLTEIARELETIRGELTNMGATGSMTEMRTSMQAGAEAAREQSAQLQQMTTNAAALDALINALTRLAEAGMESGDGARAANTAVTELVNSVASLGQTNIDSLTQLAEILRSLARMDGISVGQASMKNLVSALESLSKIPNMQGLTSLSTVDLRNFNDLHISKASLSNMAEYLPTIASADVGALQKLASISWEGLNNLSVSKAAVANLKDLAASMSGQNLAISGLKAGFDETSISTLTKSIEDSILRASKNIKLTIDNVELSAAAKATISDEVAKAASSGGSGGKRGTGELDEEKQKLNELISLYQQYYDLESKKIASVNRGEIDNADMFRARATAIWDEIAAIEAENPALAELAGSHEKVTAAVRNWQAAVNSGQAKSDATMAKRIQSETAALAEYQAQIDRLGVGSSGVKFGADTAAVAQYSAELNELKARMDAIGAASEANRGVAVAAFEAQKQKVIELRTELNNAADAAKTQAQATKLADKIDIWAQTNPKAYQNAKAQVDQWLATLRSGAPIASAQLQNISSEFQHISAQEKLAGNNGKTFFQTMKDGWRKFGGWSLVSRSFMSVIRIFKQAVTAVKEVDSAMTELRKVTDLTAEGYKSFYTEAVQMAGEVGAKLSDVIDSTADFSRLGYNIADATELSRAAMTYMNVGDSIESVDEATQSIISTMKAFKIEASDAMSIIDEFNEVGNNFAISSAGIGEALQRSASALAAAGNTIEESIGLIVAANDVVQNPESVGTALKTLTMYLRAAKTEAEEAGIETDGMAESTAKLREELLRLTGGKLDIQLDENNFKSSFQILKELSEIWDEIGEKSGDVSQANILNLLGGKRNANVLSSIITNFQDAIDASETAGDSMGSAWAENEKYLNSIEGKTKQVEAAFQTFANSVIQSDVVKAFLDIQKSILNIATELNKVGALLPAIATIVTMVQTVRNGLKAQKATQTILSMIVGGNGDVTSAIQQLTGLSNAQRLLVANNLELAVSNGAVTGTTAAGAASVASYAAAMSGATATSIGFRAALEGIKTAFMSNPIGIALLAVTAGIAMIKKGIDSVKEAADAAIKKADEIQDAYDTANKTYDQNIESLEKLRSRFEELNKKVGENGTQGSLTNDEYEEYLDIVRQIIAISPGLADHYTNVGAAIQGGYSNALQEAIGYQKELLKYENDAYLAGGQELFDGFAEKERKIRDGMAKLNNELFVEIDDAVWESVDYDTDRVAAAMDKISEIFQMSDGEALWDTKPTLQNLEEMLGYYDNMEDVLLALRSLTKEVTDSSGNVMQVPLFTDSDINNIKMTMRGYSESAKEFAQVKQDAFNYLYKYFQTDLNSLYDQIPVERIGEFKEMMEDAIVPTATLAWNKKNVETFAGVYIEALGDIENALKSDDINAAWAELQSKFYWYPSILKMIENALFGVTAAQNEAANSAVEASKSYSEMAESLSNVDKAISFLQNAQDAGNKDIIDLIKQAQEFADIMSEAGGDVMFDNLFDVGENGELEWNIEHIKTLTEDYIRLAFAETDLAKEHPEAIDQIVAQALAMTEASAEADTLKTALDDVGNAFDYISDIAAFKSGDKNVFEMLESAYKYASEHEGVNIADLIKWDDSAKSLDFVDLTEDAINGVIDTLAKELGIADDNLDNFRTTVKNAFQEAGEEADTLKSAFDAVGDAFDYIKDVSSYQSGDKALFDMLESAYKYASGHEGVNIADLIKWDDKNKTVEFVNLTEASIDGMIDTLATSLGIADKDLADFRAAVKASFDDVKEEADTLRNAITNVADAVSYMNDISSYREGSKSMIDMLESAYEYAENHEGVNLADLIRWDGSNKSIEFIDLTEASIDSMIDKLATKLNIGIDDLEAFRTAVKTSFGEVKEEADALGDAFDAISDAFDYIKDVTSFRSGEKTLFDALESAYEYASNTEGVNISDLIKWDGGTQTIQFIDLTEASINSMIDTLATELGVGEDSLEQFRSAIKASFNEVKEEADTVKDAFTAVSEAMSYMQSLSSYREGTNNLFDMLESAYDYATGHEGINLADLVKWDSSSKSVEFLDIAESSVDSMIDTLATSLGIGIDDLEAFRTAVKDAFKEVKEEADTVKAAFAAISDAFGYIDNLASYNTGDKSLFEMLESAYDYAANHEGINLSDLISWDGDNKTVEFADLAESSVDAMIDTLANELKIGVDDLETFRTAIKNAFRDAGDEAENLSDIFSAIKSGYDFISDVNKFGRGETAFFDMLESAYNLIDSYPGLTLDQILQWDESGISFKTDILTSQIETMTDNLAAALNISEENMEAFREAVRNSFGEAAEEIDGIGDAISNAKSLNSFLTDLGSQGQDPLSMLSSAVSLAEELGLKLDDVVKIDAIGNLAYDADALTAGFNTYIDQLVTAGQLSADLAAKIKEAAVAEEDLAESAKTASERMSDALSGMSSVAGSLKDALAGDSDILSMLSTASDMADAWNEAFGKELSKRKDTFDFVLFDDDSYKENQAALKDMYGKLANDYIESYISMRKEAIEAARQSGELTTEDAEDELASLAGVREELIARLIPAFDEYIDQLERANELSKMADVSDTISDVYDFINDVNSGTMTFTDAYSKALSLMEKMPDATLTDFMTINADGTVDYANGVKFLTKWLSQYIQAEVEAGTVSQDQADALLAEAKAAYETASAYEQLSNAISTVNTVSSYMTNAKELNSGSGTTSFVDMLSSAISLLEEMGEGYTLEDFFTFDPEGNIQYQTDALLNWSDQMIDNLVEQQKLSADFAEQLKLAARAEAQAVTSAQRLNSAYERTKNRTSANIGSSETQLTYADYQAMIEDNPAYAESIEYVNGVLTINRDKYYEITDAMAKETAQMALLEAAQRKLKYEDLEKQLETRADLTDDVRASMEKEIQKLKLEANGYLVLANEIANATSQFERFKAAQGSSDTDSYSTAKEAWELINDVMFNAESEFYGQYGNDKFREAVRLLIDPEFDFSEGDLEAKVNEMKEKAEKYFGSGDEDNPQTSRSNMYSFYNDLLENGFAWTDEAGFGHLQGDVESIAAALGITKDAARAALQELEQWSQVDFDWKSLDPEYWADVLASAEELKTVAEQAQADADAAKQAAAEAEQALAEAKESGDQTKIDEAEQNLENANAAAESAQTAADEAQAAATAAEAAAQKATEGEQSGAETLQKSLEEIQQTIADITAEPIEIDMSGVIESSQSVIDSFTAILEMIEQINNTKIRFGTSGSVDGGNGNGGDTGDASEMSGKQELNIQIVITPEDAIDNLTEAIGGAQTAVGELNATPVTVDASQGTASMQKLADTTNAATGAVNGLKGAGSSIGMNTSPAIGALRNLSSQLSTVSSQVNALNGKKITITTEYKETGNKPSSGGSSSGESGAGGISSARGGKTLVGELGREVVVDIDSGRWYTVGNHGPEFVTLPKRAIVYNHQKTEELLGSIPIKLSGLSMAAGSRNGTSGNSSVTGGMINIPGLSTATERVTTSVRTGSSQVTEAVEEEVNILEEIKDRFDEMNDLLEHQIQHVEFEYFNADRASDYQTMIDALYGKAELYRQIYENSMAGVNELIAAGATEGDEELQELEETAWDAYESMCEAIDQARDKLKDALDDEVNAIQSAYKTLTDAVNSYNENGTISIDTFQALMENGIQYLSLLKNENGQYEINEQAVNNLLNARKEQLAIETALSYVDRIREGLAKGETETVAALVNATNNLGTSTWGMVYANLALAKSEGLTDAQYQTALQNIQNLQQLTDIATDEVVTTADDMASSLKDAFDALNKEIDHYIAHQEQAYKVGDRAWDFNKMEAALTNEIQYYTQIAEEAQKAIDEMTKLGLGDTNESLQAVEKSLWDATNSMYDAIDKLRALRVDALNDEIDNLTSAFNSLKTASEEYSASGAMSVDTFQSLLDNGVQYLALLDKENGQYVLNNERLQEYLRMRKEQMAVETALKYIAEVREAAENGETNKLDGLIDATQGLSSATWNLVYAQAALLKDKLSNAQFNQLIANIDAIHDLAQSVETDMTKAESDVTDEYQNQIDALDQILQYTEDLIRAEADERIDAIKDEIDAYKEIIKLKKESLRQTKEENSYQQDVSDKIKEITELQAKADLLSMDSSRSASAERQKLLQEISQLQQDLADAQSDYAYDLQTEALEKEAEAYEESRQPEIDAIEESVSSTEKVYQLAIARIRDQWDTLYEDLIAWNTEQGSVINQEITDNWELACKAVAKYGSYVEALAGLEGDMNPTSDGRLVVADIPKYHGGGVAGDKGRLNDEEVLAVLQKGELVVDKQQKNGLFTIIDFVQELGRRLGAKISGLRNLSMTEAIAPNLVGATPTTSDITNNNSIVFNPQFNVTISGGEMNSANARSFGEELAETAANSLFERFNARGINIVKRLRQ